MYYTERFNSYTHLVGTILAIIGFVFLIVKAAETGDVYKIVSVSIYGTALILLYMSSTLYHSVKKYSIKEVFAKFDHCAIYFLIAGSYAPFTLVSFKGGWGWSLFGVIWSLALLGIIQELAIRERKRILSLMLYVLMGWIVLVAIYPLVTTLSWQAISWLFLGVILYTAGVYWYVYDSKIKHGHGIWHLFVLAGSTAHYVCIYRYII